MTRKTKSSYLIPLHNLVGLGKRPSSVIDQLHWEAKPYEFPKSFVAEAGAVIERLNGKDER